MQYLFSLFLTLIVCIHSATARQIALIHSPDQKISIEVLQHDKIYYRVMYKGANLIPAMPLSVTINGIRKVSVANPASIVRGSKDTLLITPWGTRKQIRDHYNYLQIPIDKELSLQFRAYNNGVAYRFVLHGGSASNIINHEEVSYRFDFNTTAWMMADQSYESNYVKRKLDVQAITDFKNSMQKIYLPMIVQASPDVKVAITEAGLYGYPSLFLDRGNDYENFLNGTFERYSTENKIGGFSNYAEVSSAQADYLAKVPGKFEFPWRLLIIAADDATLADCDLVYQLSRPSVIQNADWIRPGKVAWDWWHDYVVKGQPFKGGVNTSTYLHYIDFAAKNKLEYLLVDWLWTDKYDLTIVNPEVDIQKIISYARQKGVEVILWCPGHTLYRQLDKALDFFASLGAVGIKADFFGREDQTGIQMYEDIAVAAAKRKLLVDFHGCTKPAGLSRTYPNVINYEAVLGNEYNKLKIEGQSSADHKVMLAFTRALQGPMDYTPGGMRNAHPENYGIFFNQPMVMGTRSNEMALFVLYHEPLKMLCDAPAAYELEPQVLNFIAPIPTSWDDSKVLQADFESHIVMARRKGKEWYVAGITNHQQREVTIDFSFLDKGRYTMQLMQDGTNADKVATDYIITEKMVVDEEKFKIKMESGGGFIMRLLPE